MIPTIVAKNIVGCCHTFLITSLVPERATEGPSRDVFRVDSASRHLVGASIESCGYHSITPLIFAATKDVVPPQRNTKPKDAEHDQLCFQVSID
jgi:hypothetical protein